jgi:hypothetical protein
LAGIEAYEEITREKRALGAALVWSVERALHKDGRKGFKSLPLKMNPCLGEAMWAQLGDEPS